MPLSIPGAPPAVTAALDRLQQELTERAGNHLAGIILYGGLARGRFRPGKSDVNLVILLRDASAQVLDAIAPALQAAWRAAGVEPLILTPAEVAPAVDVFPTKFLDIKRHHLVLMGEDPFANLEADAEHVRLRIKQELHNLLLRLRRRYIAAVGDPTSMAQLLVDAARPFALELAALLRLTGKEPPADDRTGAIFEAAAGPFGLDRDVLARLAALRQDARRTDDVAGLYAGVLQAVARATEVVDRMKEAPR